MKKYIFMTIETLLFVLLTFSVILNYKAGTSAQFAVSFDGKIVLISTFTVVIVSYFIGILSGIAYAAVLGDKYKDKIEFYSRKNEKLSQQNEIDSDDKEALQRKIATLEIALENALKNK